MDSVLTNSSAAQPIESQRHANRSIVEREIVDCDDEMLALENLMIKLKHRRLALNEKLNNTSLVISMLPLDAISEIFFQVYESQDKRNFRELPAPFILGRICKAWRQIVWSSPRLWSTVAIRFSSNKYASQERLLKEWFSRVGNCQLNLFLDTVCQWEPPESLFKFLLASCSRWKTLDSWGFARLASALPSYSFPSLSLLRLRGEQNAIYDGRVFDFSRTSQLRHIHIYSPFIFKAMCKDLWDLETPMNIKQCLPALSLFQSLHSFTVKLSGNANDLKNIATTPPILLPRLTRLSLAGHQLIVARLLSAITTPSLKSLELNISTTANEKNWLRNALDLRTRSGCQLLELGVINAFINEQECIDALYALPTLTRLSLKCLSNFLLSDFTINRLNPSIPIPATGSNTLFLPNLTEFGYQGVITFRPKTMTTMLEQRLLFAQKGQGLPDNIPKIEKLGLLDIKYENNSWGLTSRSDPNILQEFYRQIISLSSRGTTLNLVWIHSPNDVT